MASYLTPAGWAAAIVAVFSAGFVVGAGFAAYAYWSLEALK